MFFTEVNFILILLGLHVARDKAYLLASLLIPSMEGKIIIQLRFVLFFYLLAESNSKECFLRN